ncbi:hypothetical protein QTI05_24240 [Variovorax sp. J22R193]|uniref:hypothetical protein n=1 Tax=Variovorax fucosicus TaxID=3053517 RepID=UPI002577C84F|nr:hypothetical protein [Variovorax sp. J22R193]MDM0042170.1 hypothetical protein [Variovorax sp. J22R193]
MPDASATTALAAFLTPTVALVGAAIAWHNMRIAKHKIKIDLFEKRLEVVNELQEVITQMYARVLPRNDPYVECLAIIKKAQWLFPNNVMVWIERNVSMLIRDMVIKIGEIEVADDDKALRQELSEMRKRLVESDNQFHWVFSAYLELYKH